MTQLEVVFLFWLICIAIVLIYLDLLRGYKDFEKGELFIFAFSLAPVFAFIVIGLMFYTYCIVPIIHLFRKRKGE